MCQVDCLNLWMVCRLRVFPLPAAHCADAKSHFSAGRKKNIMPLYKRVFGAITCGCRCANEHVLEAGVGVSFCRHLPLNLILCVYFMDLHRIFYERAAT